jgi:hypothetical protein
MNTPYERLTRTTFSLPLGEVHALVVGAVNARPLLFPASRRPALYAIADARSTIITSPMWFARRRACSLN